MLFLEWAAAALGVVNVALVIRRSIWNYPFGIAMVSLYFFVFLSARLYSDALLQIFFLLVQVYGWRNWSQSIRTAGEVRVQRLSPTQRAAWLTGTLAASFAWGSGMAAFTNAAAPLVDAAIAGMSVSAQILLARRRLESWLLWIAVDLLAVGLFASRGLWVTSALYALFLVMATIGFVAWLKALHRPAARAPA